jgi:hypothetical protein
MASVTGPTSLHRQMAFVGGFLRDLPGSRSAIISFWEAAALAADHPTV